MDFLSRVIPFTLIAISIFLIRIYMMSKSSKELLKTWHQEHVVLRFPSIFFWIGFLDVLFFSACLFIMFFFPNGTEAWWVWTEFILFILLGFYLMSYVLLFKIDV